MAGADEIARAELDALRARGLLRELEPLRTPPGAEIELRPGERPINFSSNDYLGLAGEPRIAEALAEALAPGDPGAGASRLVCGDFLPAARARARAGGVLAAARPLLLFASGYAANCGIVPAFAGAGGPGPLRRAEPCLDHRRLPALARARRGVSARDVARRRAAACDAPARRKIVVTDAVFSMDGDRAPLRELAAVCSARRSAC